MEKAAVTWEIKRLADFRSVKLTRFALIFLLFIHFLFSIYYHGGPYSMYILPMALILPPFTASLVKNGINSGKKEKRDRAEKEYRLSCLMSHYHFSPEKLIGESAAFYFLIAACMMWQQRNNAAPYDVVWYNYYPAFVMSFGVIFRLILYIFHRIFLPYKVIRHNY